MFKTTFSLLFKDFFLVWIFACIGIAVLFIHPKIKNRLSVLYILLFFIFSFFSVCPGFYFREHYFITLLPSLALLFSIVPDYFDELALNRKAHVLKYIGYGIIIAPVFIGIIAQRDYLFKMKPNEISREIYGLNPFPESRVIAEYIKANSSENDKICILGSEPQIFFYANRKSATGYIYTYSLMENHKNSLKMQKEMISEIEASNPSHLLYFDVSTSWMAKAGSEKYIFNWINTYIQQNGFQLKGIVDIYPDKTIYKWDCEAWGYRPQSEFYVQIFERQR